MDKDNYIKSAAASMAIPNVGATAARHHLKHAETAFYSFQMDLRLELEENLTRYLESPTPELKAKMERLLFKLEKKHWPEEKWMVVRQDDSGNRFSSHGRLTKEAAEEIAAKMESHGHKQMFTVEEMTEENMKTLLDAITFQRRQNENKSSL